MAEAHVEYAPPRTQTRTTLGERIALLGCVAFSLITLVYPVVRSLYRVEMNYNEGWNAYNAQAVLQHLPLYPVKYGWRTVNYPMISFYLIGSLSRVFGDPVRIGRLLSLSSFLISCVLVAMIVKKLTGKWGPSAFAGCFCLALLCSFGGGYLAANDPQMLGHPFFLTGILLYLSLPLGNASILAITVLFILGGNIKHNLIPVPIAVFSDLLIGAPMKAGRFLLFGIIFGGLSIWATEIVAGRFYVSNLLTPREYSFLHALHSLAIFGTLQIPLFTSIGWSFLELRNKKLRIVAIYFLASLVVGFAFSGGAGTAGNVYFDSFFAMSIIVGLCLDDASRLEIPFLARRVSISALVLFVLYFAPVFAFMQTPYVKLPHLLAQLPDEERVFESEVSFLAAQPGPVLCESLLRCFYAGKPYVVDPFNSTSLIRSGKLNGQDLVRQIASRRFSAIQIFMPVGGIHRPYDRFPDEVLDTVDQYYKLSVSDPYDCVIYVPR